jgi:PAS domain S-box-containing protein
MNLAPGAMLASLRRRCPGLTIQATAGVLVAAVVLLLVGLDLWHTWTARALNLEVARIQAQNLADALAQQIARSIDLIDVPLREVQDLAATEGLDPARAPDLTDLLHRRARITPQLRDLVVLDRTGQRLASTLVRPPREAMAPHRDFFTDHRDNADRGVAVSAPYLSHVTGRFSIAISRRLDGPDGEFLGVVLAAMDLSFFDALYDSYSVGQHGAIALFRSDGTLLTRRPLVAGALGRNLATGPLFQDHVALANSGSFIASSLIDGVRRLETYRRLVPLPLVVLIATAEDDALAGWRHDAVAHLIGIGLLAIVVSLLAWRIAVLWRQQRAAEVKASQAMADYRLLADNAGDMIVVNDLATFERRYMSPASRFIYGRSPEELVGTSPMDFVHPDDRGQLQALWLALKAGDDRSMSCHRIRMPDDQWIWVETKSRIVRDAAGRPTGDVVSVVRDVSERVHAEAELRESEARYRLLAENATDMIIRLTLDGKRVYISPAYREILGYETAELEQGPAGDIIFDADRPGFAALLADLAAGRCDSIALEYRVHHRDGHLIWVETRLKLVRDAATSTPVEIVGVVRDISRQKATEERLRAAHDEAERSNRMRSAFFSNMSHELRTPLNAVIGFADLMRHESLGPLGLPKYREYAEDIHASGEHLLGIINDILDFAKLEAGALVLHQEPVQLGALAATSCRLMAAKAEQKGIELSFAAADAGLDAQGDPIRIKQVLLNLLSNAIKFTPAGGRVTVTAGAASDGSPAVSVADTGIGIAVEDLAKVVEPFGQVDNARNREGDGTGLGLPLSRRLMEMHGGTLDIASQLGAGTTVTARFRRAEADAEVLAV